MPITPTANYWQGSGSFFPLTFTPFGFYDNDPQFQSDAESIATWAAYRLGFPVLDVELQEVNFYAAFEEAVNEYGAQLNFYQARDQMLNLSGQSTGSQNLSQTYITPSLIGIFKLAKAYGTEVGSGGTQTYYTGSITLTANKQVYDLTRDASVESGSFATDQFTIRKIFHERAPASLRMNDPSINSYNQNLLEEFSWGGYGSIDNYMLMPIYHDLLRTQAVEFNDQMRRSGYSFQLTGNRLRIFPIPSDSIKLWFHYTLDREAADNSSGTGKISDASNIPFQNVTYRFINQIGKQWIRKYALAIIQEMLGYVRIKYASIPIPDGEITLNGDQLVTAGKTLQDALIEELRESFESLSSQAQLERKVAEAEAIFNHLKRIPNKIYIG